MTTPGVPLTGLTPQASSSGAANAPATPVTPQKQKGPKNVFLSVDTWVPEYLANLHVHIGEVEETTGDFTRRQKPNSRYWKALITFTHGPNKSRIIKMGNRDVPYVKATKYGESYVYANLDRRIANLIQRAAQDKGLIVAVDDPKLQGVGDSWWCTINNMEGKVVTIDQTGGATQRDLARILDTTEHGVGLNLDLIFFLRFSTDNKRDRTNKDHFRIGVECSRASLKELNRAVEPPATASAQITQQPAKCDQASQELIDALNAMNV